MTTKTANPKPDREAPSAASCCGETPKDDAKQTVKASKCGCAEKEPKASAQPSCCK